ncbi:MAG TPA: metalloregulator ArsR/SmtB family transcription factor [Acidobacteriota bacterium]|nr:metalloregulator ArsR/SmtB family transcription factor [Acidobacteriota bacterium]
MRREGEVFKALSDETRLRIVQLLQKGELCVCEIVDSLGLPQYQVSKHLTILRFAGLVDFERKGTRIHYSLRKKDPVLAPLFPFLRRFLRDANQPSGRAASHRRLP